MGCSRPRLRAAALASVAFGTLTLPDAVRSQCTPIFHVSVLESVPLHSDHPDEMGGLSMRVDTSGRAHVAFKRRYGPVRYATRLAGPWSVETAFALAERNVAVVLDSKNAPSILFQGGILRRENGSWTSHAHNFFYVEHLGGTAARDGSIHAVVLQSFSGGIYYGTASHVLIQGNSWIVTGLEQRFDAFTSPNASISMLMDANGVPRYCITHTWNVAVRYWEGIGTPELESISNARWGSLDIDSRGIIHLAYYDVDSMDLVVATYGVGGWSKTSVDTEGDVGAWASLALDANDAVHIAYYDRDAKDLRYAFRAPSSDSWTRCTVDAHGDVGSWISLDLDPQGKVHIAYLDLTTRAVKYATTQSPLAVRPSTWKGVKAAFR